MSRRSGSPPYSSKLICIDDVAVVLDDQDCVPGRKFHWQFAFIAQNPSLQSAAPFLCEEHRSNGETWLRQVRLLTVLLPWLARQRIVAAWRRHLPGGE